MRTWLRFAIKIQVLTFAAFPSFVPAQSSWATGGGTPIIDPVGFSVAGAPVNCGYFAKTPKLSADGQRVFLRTGCPLDSQMDSGSGLDFYIVDRPTRSARLVTRRATGLALNSAQLEPGTSYELTGSVSADFQSAVFVTVYGSIVNQDTNGVRDVFLWQSLNEEISRVSVTSSGQQADGNSDDAVVTNGGTYVLFSSFARNLLQGTPTQSRNLFLWPRSNGEHQLIASSIATAEAIDSVGVLGSSNTSSYSALYDLKTRQTLSPIPNGVIPNPSGCIWSTEYMPVNDAYVASCWRTVGPHDSVFRRISDWTLVNVPNAWRPVPYNEGRSVAYVAQIADGARVWSELRLRDLTTGADTRVPIGNSSYPGALGLHYLKIESVTPDGRWALLNMNLTGNGLPGVYGNSIWIVDLDIVFSGQFE